MLNLPPLALRPPSQVDNLMYDMIDAWCELDHKSGDDLTHAEDVLLGVAAALQLALMKRQVERGVFSREDYIELCRNLLLTEAHDGHA